jgi:hypothetical protein
MWGAARTPAGLLAGPRPWSCGVLMTENPRVRAPRRGPASGGPTPKHPTRQAILLLVGVTLLIVALAVLSSSGGI